MITIRFNFKVVLTWNIKESFHKAIRTECGECFSCARSFINLRFSITARRFNFIILIISLLLSIFSIPRRCDEATSFEGLRSFRYKPFHLRDVYAKHDTRSELRGFNGSIVCGIKAALSGATWRDRKLNSIKRNLRLHNLQIKQWVAAPRNLTFFEWIRTSQNKLNDANISECN